MTDEDILRKAFKKAEECKINKTCFTSWMDYHNERDIKYRKHYQVIFSHEFAKAFWGEGDITRWWILITTDLINKSVSKIFNKTEFIKLYGKECYKKCQKIIIPSYATDLNELNMLMPENPKIEFLNCFKKQYKNLISYDTNEDWKYHLQQMVLEEEPLKYIERFL